MRPQTNCTAPESSITSKLRSASKSLPPSTSAVCSHVADVISTSASSSLAVLCILASYSATKSASDHLLASASKTRISPTSAPLSHASQYSRCSTPNAWMQPKLLVSFPRFVAEAWQRSAIVEIRLYIIEIFRKPSAGAYPRRANGWYLFTNRRRPRSQYHQSRFQRMPCRPVSRRP